MLYVVVLLIFTRVIWHTRQSEPHIWPYMYIMLLSHILCISVQKNMAEPDVVKSL